MALDSFSQGGVGFASSCTFSHTIGGGANRLLVVNVFAQTSTSGYITGVTYNGAAMTQASFSPQTFGSTVWTFYLKESSLPAAGTYNIVVSATGAGAFEAHSFVWDSVNQTTPIPAQNTSINGTYNSPLSDSLTVASGNYAVDTLVQFTTTNAMTMGAGQTQISQATNQFKISASYKLDATAMSQSWASGQINGIHIVLEIASAADTTPPTTPTGLSVTSTTASSITIGWTPGTDNVAVTGNDVEVADGAGSVLATNAIGAVATYTLSGLSAGTVRKFRVRAKDAAGNTSSYTAQVTGTALDTSAPTTPSGLAVSASTTTSITWTWSAATDNVAVTGYRIRRRDAANAIIDTVDLGNVLTYTWTGLSATNQRGLEVAAFDAAGNVSAFSSVVTGTASASGDTSPPTVPTSLAVIATTSTSITWGWSASTDVGGGVVAGYRIQRLNSDDSVIDTVDIGTITQYQWTGLTGSTTKKIKVAAFDNAGTPNVSSYSSAVSGTTAVAAAQLYARITLNRPATLSDPSYPPVAVTMPGMVYKGWPGDAGFSLATGVKVTFTVGNLNEIAAPMPLTWGDGTTVAAGEAGFAFATNWNGTVTVVNATHGQIGSRFTVGA